MTNLEKFKNELMPYFCSSITFGVGQDDTIISCIFEDDCAKCKFEGSLLDTIECASKRERWLKSEYKEPVYLTDKEKTFLSIVSNRYNAIARNNAGNLFIFNRNAEVHKSGDLIIASFGDDRSHNEPVSINISQFFEGEDPFEMVKTSDPTPWNISDLLKLPVKG